MNARARLSGRDGFTLIEALVAFTILALVMVVVQRGVMAAVGGTARADTRIGAELVARSLMTTPLVSGPGAIAPQTGQMNGYTWTLRFAPLDLPFAAGIATDGKPVDWTPVRMIVDVSDARRQGAALTIETIRLVRMGSP